MYDSQAVAQAIDWPAIPDTEPPRDDLGHPGDPPQSKPISMKSPRRVGEHVLRLYVAGETVVSQKARENLQRLCERCETAIETVVIDVLDNPEIADRARILATPTLVYDHPGRSKRVIGDLSAIEKVIGFLGLQERDECP